MRAFFCLPLESNVKAAVGRAAERLRRETRMSASWVEPANYHVTLRFLGEIEPALTVDLERLASQVASSAPAFSLQVDSLGAFPSLERARVLWAGGETPDAFSRLVEALERGLADLGFPREPKPPLAHVTIARLKGAADPRLARVVAAIGRLEVEPCDPRSIVLMQSDLGPRGAQYTPLFTVPLGRRDGA